MIDFLRAWLDTIVFGILGLMSFLMLWFAFERLIYFWRVRLRDFDHPDMLGVALTRNLTWISTIGANAPYVGLLGTVFGILITFYDIGQSSNIEPAAIMTGLALALKATAAGLLVAIPSIMIYNGLLRKVEVLTANWKRLQS
ncbi:MAG: TonB-system energizer ExbB, partial [Sedimenticolaceae bacterium]|nr:TonB-system energizer ExbB [Sedimenticolaceae bacterium]